MQSTERYESPFSARYASPEMQRLFSRGHRARVWRKLWVILAQSQYELGLPVSREQVAQLHAHMDMVDLDAADRYEKELRHDVMAHLKAFADDCPLAAPIIHLGATSCYVTDNGDILILRDALRLVRGRLAQTALALANFANQYKDLPTLGFTHFQPAQPTTVGKRAALWLQDLLEDAKALDALLDDLRPLGNKGTTGTQASFLALFEGDQEKTEALDLLIAQKMGFDKPVALSSQTYSRKWDSRILHLLSGIAQSAAKFAGDLRLLAHLKEIEEPFEASQVGSSAMPYKRNPMRAERMTALSRYIITNAMNADQTAASQWLERTLDDSANRRLSLAEGFLAADGLLSLYLNVAKGLVVYPRMIEKHLKEELPFMATENILMRAVMRGGNRQELHERLRLHAMAAGLRVKEDGLPNDLLSRIADDPAFGLSHQELDSLMNPSDYTGRAAWQVTDYLNGEGGEILGRLQQYKAPAAEITL
ncbi:MAG: adenylosuccinate lyase [Eubacteriales bacterium]|nr:adenylosuccinate lyase [Eubacteriales bacterium]